MRQPDFKKPLTQPSLKYFVPYRQTVAGFVIVAALVASLILSVQWLLGGG